MKLDLRPSAGALTIAAALADLAASGVQEGASGPPLENRLSRRLPPDAYQLTATRRGGIQLLAGSPTAAAYGLESLAQQSAFDGGHLRPLAIEDSPRLPFRGPRDSCRHRIKDREDQND